MKERERNLRGASHKHTCNGNAGGEKREKKNKQKNIQRNNGRKLPEFDEKHYSTHP